MGLVLGIETSCDETSAAVLDEDGRVLSNVVSSQMRAHARYGGVVPEVAARAHLENLPAVLEEALERAGVGLEEIGTDRRDRGPRPHRRAARGPLGREGASPSRGICRSSASTTSRDISSPPSSARAASRRCPRRIPSTGSSSRADTRSSSGSRRTSIVALARTRDDAPGEAFDKIARRAGLGYPGGPVVDRIADEGPRRPLSVPHRPRGRRLARLLLLRAEDGDAARAREAPRRRIAARPRGARPGARGPARVVPAGDRRRPARPRRGGACGRGHRRARALRRRRGQLRAPRDARGLGPRAPACRCSCPTARSRPTTRR